MLEAVVSDRALLAQLPDEERVRLVMAAGRAIVASAVDGTPEAVVDGRNGLLFAAGDTAAGATHVLRLLTDPGLRSTLAQAGRQAVGEFDQDTMVRQQEALYTQLLVAVNTR